MSGWLDQIKTGYKMLYIINYCRQIFELLDYLYLTL